MTLSKVVSLGSRASISLPSLARAEFDERIGAFLIKLEEQIVAGAPTTEVVISEMPITEVAPLSEDGNMLAELARQFLLECAKVESVNVSVSEFDDQWVAQGVGFSGGDRYWIVRMIYKRLGETFWMLHWNGPEAIAVAIVLPILESFEF